MARILLIDNEAQSREIMRNVLVEANHDVLEAEHGRLGMALLQTQPFDLVITEMLMPEVDGVEVIRNVRTLHPGAKIIALSRTGRASPYLYLTIAAKLGAHKVLAKPFQPAELLQMVTEVLNGAPETQ